MNEYDPWLAYQRIRKNNTAIIDYVCSQYGITGKAKHLMTLRTYGSLQKGFDSNPEQWDPILEKYGQGAITDANSYLSGLRSKIRTARSAWKSYKFTNKLHDEKERSVQFADQILNRTYPSQSFDVYGVNSQADDPSWKCRSTFLSRYSSHEVRVPLSWNSTVYQKNIEVVHSGKGPRFILQAKERMIERLNEDNISAYKCKALYVYNGRLEGEDLWVLKGSGYSENVIACGEDFLMTERLLQRRVRKAVMAAMELET
jgi:hypothetical protein